MDAKAAYQWTTAAQTKLLAADRLYNSAVGYASKKEYDSAQRVLRDVVRIRKGVLPANDITVLKAMDLQASLFAMTGEKFKLREILRELVRMYREKFGDYNSETMHMMERYHKCLKDCGDDRDADFICREIWYIRGKKVSTNTEFQDLNTLLDTSAIPPDMMKRIDTTINTIPSMKVVGVTQKTSRFLADGWDPLKELEVAKMKKANGGQLPENFDVDAFTTNGTYVKPEETAPQIDPVLMAAAGMMTGTSNSSFAGGGDMRARGGSMINKNSSSPNLPPRREATTAGGGDDVPPPPPPADPLPPPSTAPPPPSAALMSDDQIEAMMAANRDRIANGGEDDGATSSIAPSTTQNSPRGPPDDN